jgi:hypothetical protein
MDGSSRLVTQRQKITEFVRAEALCCAKQQHNQSATADYELRHDRLEHIRGETGERPTNGVSNLGEEQACHH